ncbi:MAG TPA: precorrin-6y C5,15-methyltransferase (decarboxylating) subunit CbiE [Bacillota bacterium]|nr:precorrin-6y C5,15-methyltransferase (decarboxylating) subunit CbiE [Bacillota bacterium]
MEKVDVVGVGPGAPEYVTPAALKAVEKADVLVGGERNLAIFRGFSGSTFEIKNNLEEMIDFIKKNRMDNKKVAVLASGDPGMFGILACLRENFSPADLNVIPGISTVQYACARLAIPWHDAVAVSTHGRGRNELVDRVYRGQKVVVLPGPAEPPYELARTLKAAGAGNKRVFVCSDLSYPDEEIRFFFLEELAAVCEAWEKRNYVMVILNE